MAGSDDSGFVRVNVIYQFEGSRKLYSKAYLRTDIRVSILALMLSLMLLGQYMRDYRQLWYAMVWIMVVRDGTQLSSSDGRVS